MTTLHQRLRDWFSLDTRSLAVARMGFGVFVFIDMLWRLTSAEWHYTDLGVMPRDVFLGQFSYAWSWSVHMANGSLGFAVFMLLLHGFSALAMAVGWHTRLATLVVALLNISLHNRNWYLNNGGDDLLRVTMFLAVFIPWGEMWSVDQWRQGEGQREARRVSGSWVCAWFLQTFVVYFISYILKTSPIWRSEYSAIYYSSHLDIFSTGIGRLIRGFPRFMQFSTFMTIMLEWMGPLVLCLGWAFPRRGQGWLRFMTVLAFWGLHLGIILTMSIGLFPFYCLAMWATFLPTELWDKILARFPQISASLHKVLAKLSGSPVIVQGPRPVPKWMSAISQVAGGFIFLVVLFWNLSTLKPPLKVQIPFWAEVGRHLHLYQEWNMFAPFPKQENLWLEIPAELEDGSTIELLSGDRDVLSSKEHVFPHTVGHEHWRKFYMNLADNEKIAKHYAGAWCRLWNRDPAKGGRTPRLRRFSINVLHQVIQPNYQRSPLQKRVLWNHFCFEADLKGPNPGL